MTSVIQLKVFLSKRDRQSDPGIYRRLLIMDNINFYDLHCMIQIAFGWRGAGLHEFRDFFDPDDLICNDFDHPWGAHGTVYDSQLYPVKGFLRPNALLTYEYLAEDNFQWKAILFVEDILDKEARLKYPLCLTGKKNAPPEDCGGWEGFDELVHAMKTKKGNTYKRYIDLFHLPYDANQFDLERINKELSTWRAFLAQSHCS